MGHADVGAEKACLILTPESGFSAAAFVGLKAFQRRTAKHAFERLYAAEDGSRRFLVADEVGLGKTLVAAAVIAKAIDHLQSQGTPRIDVIYICSNQAIARQNVNRIKNRIGVETKALAERITLLPHRIASLDERVNFIALTPGTSFGSARAEGVAEERVILYRMLEKIWGAHDNRAAEVFRGDLSSAARFHEYCSWYRQRDFDEGILRRFAEAVGGCGDCLHQEFLVLCELLTCDQEWPAISRRRQFIAKLRRFLAHACLDALEPDLVVLDEFQRFRSLLDEGTSSGELAARLFDYEDAHTQTRTVLLSATPYKMYTLADESDDDHYRDFLRTITFLEGPRVNRSPLDELLRNFRLQFPAAATGHQDDHNIYRLRQLRSKIESRLRRVMARTERRGREDGGDPMLKVEEMPATLDVADVEAFLDVRELARLVDAPAVTEYWKSSPYLLSFMDRYRLTQRLHEAIETKPDGAVAGLVGNSPKLQIPRDRVRNRGHVDGGNGRMRALLDHIEQSGLHGTLWLPPSLPSHELGCDFERARSTTKSLVFSSWAMAPRAIAIMASYDAERRYITDQNRAERFDGRLLAVTESAHSLFALVTPSHTLARFGDALRHRARNPRDLLRAIAEMLRPAVAGITADAPQEGAYQTIWYAAAPLLLDQSTDHPLDWVTGPLNQGGGDGDERESSAWPRLLARVKNGLVNPAELGRPPENLVEVLAALAAGSPANATLRSLSRTTGKDPTDPTLKRSAMEAGWAFRSLFRAPTSEGLLRGLYQPQVPGGDGPYWRRVLAYSLEGGLTDVLDEYFHVLSEANGVELGPQELVEALIRTVRMPARSLGTHRWQPGRNGIGRETINMRQHIARRYGPDRISGIDRGPGAHLDALRAAFNSPFWPFVLSTTSVGQEGLDFHWYCHSVVHWNLPPNPVDLEQREGRIHRYHGHAIRKNIAQAVGDRAQSRSRADIAQGDLANPWDAAYQLADEDFGGDHGLVPHWVFDVGDSRIQRHAPILPLSRDEAHMTRLRRSLAVYRMVFGQPRQDDLLEFILREVPADRQLQLAADLTINLGPPELEDRVARSAK